MTVNKKMIIIGTLVAALIIALVGATVAFFQAQTDDTYNTFGVGEVDVDIPETFIPDGDGNRATKLVPLENIGSVDAYVRAMIVPTFRDSENGVSLGCTVDYTTVNNGYILVTGPDGKATFKLHLEDNWQQNWYFQAADNTFCYRFVLPPKTQTPYLMIEVSREDCDNWQNINVDILAEALQTGGDVALQYLREVWGVDHIAVNGELIWN